MTQTIKRSRVTGAARDKLARDLIKRYEKGQSIREMAQTYGRSYGFVRDLLTESGVTLRARGGPRIPAGRGAGARRRACRPAIPANLVNGQRR